MILNYIWIGFILIAFLFAVVQSIPGLEIYNPLIWEKIVQSLFGMAETGFEISLGLTGVLCLWMGIMKIGENGGAIALLTKLVNPLFSKIFPDIPKNHPAQGSIIMNFSANMLGLDNAATPLGLKAMQQLQDINKEKSIASNPMIMFLVLNTSGLTLIPVSVMVYRTQQGAADPTDVFLPILIATFISSLTGLLIVSLIQKINLLDKIILAYVGGAILLIVSLILWLNQMDQVFVSKFSKIVSNMIIFSLVAGFVFLGVRKKINVYDSFIDGAKDGFKVAIGIIPYLIAILVAIGVFRASGALDLLMDGITYIALLFTEDTKFIDALPTAIMKPLSGSGARGMMVDTMETHGADSFAGRLASVFQGTTETTFYVLAVYFGSVKIKNTRYAAGAGLLADLFGIITAIFVAYLFFGKS